MIVVPSVIEKTSRRPNRPQFEEPYLIPNRLDHDSFWVKIYGKLQSLNINSPYGGSIKEAVNDLYGYYGFRVHPVTRESRYFHAGISLDLPFGTEITPVLPGVLEYSGYGAVNGYYVLLSHPQIQTEDGYVLHSMYCHLKKPLIKFNSYQKMLREISLGSYPLVPVPLEQVLGVSSVSGFSRDSHPGIHLQLSLRKFDQTPIVLDPMLIYGDTDCENTTADVYDQEKICKIFPEIKK